MNTGAQVVLAAIRAVEERDVERLLELCHENVEFHDASSLPYGGSICGKEVLRQRLETAPQETWLGTWGPLQPTERERRMDPRVVTESGNEVVVAYRERALSPHGERFEAPVLALYQVRDGRFARAQMFHFDTTAILEFLRRAGNAAPQEAP